jgi:hypothetical protein
MGFGVLVVGGTGQVGSGLVRALLAARSCTEVVMVNRRTIPLAADARLRQVILDTGAANFASEMAELARAYSAHAEPFALDLRRMFPGILQVVDEPSASRPWRFGSLVIRRHRQHEAIGWHIIDIEDDQRAGSDVFLDHVQRHAAPSNTVLQKRVLGGEVREAPSRWGHDAKVPTGQ